MKRIGLSILLLVAFTLCVSAQQSVKTPDVFNKFRSYTGVSSQDTLKKISSYTANLDSATVKHLVRINVNTPIASDSIFIWQATNPTGALYFAKIIIPSTAPPSISIPVDAVVDSAYVIIKRYKTSDVTLIYRVGY